MKGDIIGQRFGRLLVIKEAEKIGNRRSSLCKCTCGNTVKVRLYSLISGNTYSCGCLRKERLERRNYKHGLSLDGNGNRSRLYGRWNRMKQRCSDAGTTDFKNYGGRGIKVCDEWANYQPFHDWALANGYDDNLSIERIDNEGNYEPGNCTWVRPEQQARNKRTNHRIRFHGVTKILAEWSRELRIETSLLRYRIKAWGVEKAFTIPVRRQS